MIEHIEQHGELKSDLEVSEVEERKNTLIEKLKENHSEALNNLKVYYTEITINNLSIIANLKVRDTYLTYFKSVRQIFILKLQTKHCFEFPIEPMTSRSGNFIVLYFIIIIFIHLNFQLY